jgi:hypothetical protein
VSNPKLAGILDTSTFVSTLLILHYGECFVEFQTLNMLETTFQMIVLMAIAFWATVRIQTHLATVSWNG